MWSMVTMEFCAVAVRNRRAINIVVRSIIPIPASSFSATTKGSGPDLRNSALFLLVLPALYAKAQGNKSSRWPPVSLSNV